MASRTAVTPKQALDDRTVLKPSTQIYQSARQSTLPLSSRSLSTNGALSGPSSRLGSGLNVYSDQLQTEESQQRQLRHLQEQLRLLRRPSQSQLQTKESQERQLRKIQEQLKALRRPIQFPDRGNQPKGDVLSQQQSQNEQQNHIRRIPLTPIQLQKLRILRLRQMQILNQRLHRQRLEQSKPQKKTQPRDQDRPAQLVQQNQSEGTQEDRAQSEIQLEKDSKPELLQKEQVQRPRFQVPKIPLRGLQKLHTQPAAQVLAKSKQTVSVPGPPQALKLESGTHPIPSVVNPMPQKLPEVQPPVASSQQQQLKPQDMQKLAVIRSASPVDLDAIMEAAGKAASADSSIVEANPTNRAIQLSKHVVFLRRMKHSVRCTAAGHGSCTHPNYLLSCKQMGELLSHIKSCRSDGCEFSSCKYGKFLTKHHETCSLAACPVCIPVKHGDCRDVRCTVCNPVRKIMAVAQKKIAEGVALLLRSDGKKTKAPEPSENEEVPQPGKKLKAEPGGPVSASRSSATASNLSLPVKEEISQASKEAMAVNVRMENTDNDDDEDEPVVTLRPAPTPKLAVDKGQTLTPVPVSFSSPNLATPAAPTLPQAPTLYPVTVTNSKGGKALNPGASDPARSSRKSFQTSAKSALKGVGMSLVELFPLELIATHLKSLRDGMAGQPLKGKADKGMVAPHCSSGNECKLCGVEKLTYSPPPIYCTMCGRRIQRHKVYYTFGAGENKFFFCGKCHGDLRSEKIEMEGFPTIPKSKLEKQVNNEEPEESWVECATCKKWVHQVCALFNVRRNAGNSDFTCPVCCAEEMRKGTRQPLPPSTVLGAKDLPRTYLSDELENRLFASLKTERARRAAVTGKPIDKVPGADELVIRVVSSVDKEFETKSNFIKLFEKGKYPSRFPYTSKVLLLFQRIEGVEVCLFGMYVQEFGTDCEQPNSRRIYLSYLDSVKYFRPEVRTEQREALRTFVYHEILIGYLEYSKKRGFTSCYIWACPPLKGEDYILYCHPEIQKTPQTAKLREWYLSMLKKAQDQGIVTEVTNLYESFFLKCGESRAPVSPSRLPYFDGDYWPGAIEEVLQQIAEEGKEKAKQDAVEKNNPGGKAKKSPAVSRRGAAGSSGQSIGTVLMSRLGNAILPLKEDFIMVHMRYCCSHCKSFILGDTRIVCKSCPHFNLCPKCYAMESRRTVRERHPALLPKEAHKLTPEAIPPIPEAITDKDAIMESEFFDTRQNFLSLCQGNHYQYDTLRRAKHSSMMVLYHLHNPTAPAFAATCNVCQSDIEAGHGWRCAQCDFDVCEGCYPPNPPHPHPLNKHATHDATAQDAQDMEGRCIRVNRQREILDELQHAAVCKIPFNNCDFPKCRKLHKLFKHGLDCPIRVNGGCKLCKQMWLLLRFHARHCRLIECRVPRCRDLKMHMKRMVHQAESRRRAAVQVTARNQAGMDSSDEDE